MDENVLSMPCPHMIFDASGYFRCELMPFKKTFCLCAWFYDLNNPGFTVEVSVDSKGKPTSVSDFDFPDSNEMKELRENTVTEDDVPKICPKGFTFKQIDAKIQPLMAKVDWKHRP
jgi:hypothetical protein